VTRIFPAEAADRSFDPDKLVERFEAGDSLAELMSVGREHVPAT